MHIKKNEFHNINVCARFCAQPLALLHKVEFRDSARIEAAFRKYFHRASPRQKHDSYEVLVLHGNVIRYMTCR